MLTNKKKKNIQKEVIIHYKIKLIYNFLWVLYHFDLPVDIPLLHVAEAPGLDSISCVGIHPDQTIVGDSNQLLLLSTLEPAQE